MPYPVAAVRGKNFGVSFFPFSDDFDRANGAIGGAWTGATWTIASNVAVNTPTATGGDVIVNGAFAADTDWTKGTGVTIAAGVAVINHVGGLQAHLLADIAPFTVGKWYTSSCLFSVTSGYTAIYIGNADWGSHSTSGTHITTGRAITDGRCQVTSGACVITLDDLVAEELTLSTLFCTQPTSSQDVTADVDIIQSEQSQAGVVICLDSAASPANFIIGSHSGDSNRARLTKCVGGTYTNLINTTATYSSGATLRVIKDGESVELWYDGNKIGATQTVSDAGVKDNTIHGLFSTYSGVTLDNFVLSLS